MIDKQNSMNNNGRGKMGTAYDNILYSQLTKGAVTGGSGEGPPNSDNLNNNTPKVEDLSQYPHHDLDHNNSHTSHDFTEDENQEQEDHSGNVSSLDANVPNDLRTSIKREREIDVASDELEEGPEDASPGSAETNNHESCKSQTVLNDLLFNNNNVNVTNNNNNNNDIKVESDVDDFDTSTTNEAVEHGEKFLKWLETYSDPNVTAMQVMQFKFLLNTIKSSADRANNPAVVAGSVSSDAAGQQRIKIRRRK